MLLLYIQERIPLSPYLVSVNFAILMGFFAQTAWAHVYRLSHIESDNVEMVRPKRPFPDREKVFRVINLTAGAPLSSFNSEFVVRGGELKRIKSERVDHVMELMLAQIMENMICENNMSAGTKKDFIGPGQALRERTYGPIDHQALREMIARKYLSPEEANSYVDSTSMNDPGRMIYFESLSWLSAVEVLEIFDGKIPWTRVSEVEAREGLGSNEVRKLAESGDPSVRLRIRRATVRAVSALGLQITPDHRLELFAEDLPFEAEFMGRGIALPHEADPILYRFELGRASQIPGLESEAEQLSALAGLVVWHQSMTLEDLRTGRRSDIWHVDADIFMHALKRTHHLSYTEYFGAKDYVKGAKPHDVVLKVTLKQFLDKTLPKLGLDAEAVRSLAVKADAIDGMRWDLDWTRGGQILTRHHPITMRMSRAMAERVLRERIVDVPDQQLKQRFVRSALEVYDQVSNYQFPESRTPDPYVHAKHSKISTDYFVSGLDMWTATNRSYVPAFMAVMAKFFNGVDDAIRITVVVPQTPDGSRHLVSELTSRGFQYIQPTDELEFWNGPHALRITVKKLNESVQKFPEIAAEMKVESDLKPGVWRAQREINLLPGL